MTQNEHHNNEDNVMEFNESVVFTLFVVFICVTVDCEFNRNLKIKSNFIYSCQGICNLYFIYKFMTFIFHCCQIYRNRPNDNRIVQ